MDKEELELVLKKYTRESEIAAIVNVEAVPALPKGENCTSTVLRLKLKVVLGNDRVTKRTLIMKQIANSKCHSESEIYSIIHKEMTYLIEEFQDTDETLWCNFIHYIPQSSTLLLEDLQAQGYNMFPRETDLDLEHTILALRGLGRYHGMAKVLEERGIISKDYKPHAILNDPVTIKGFFHTGILNSSKVMLHSWGHAWEHTAKRMIVSFEKFFDKFKKMGQYKEYEFTVLNHGDCCSNNMMFKYDHQQRPIIVKFLGYQSPHYNTPCVDVTNFIYLSVQPAVRRSNYELLLRTYHDSLVRSLDKFGFTGAKPTLQEITATMDRLEFFGLSLFVTGYASGSSTKAFDVEKIRFTDGNEGFDEHVFKKPGIIERMGSDIIDFVDKHLKSL